MNLRRILFLACCLGILGAVAGTSAPLRAEVIKFKVGGTGSALGTMRALADAFQAIRPNCVIEVLPSLDSSGGIRALIDGAIAVAVSGRPLKPAEIRRAPNVSSYRYADSPLVLVTSYGRPVSLTSSELARLYSDPAARWPDGTPLRIVLRPEDETDYDLVSGHFAGMAEAIAAARRRPELPLAGNDQQNLNLAEKLKGSLTTATLAQVISEGRDLRLLTVDGVAPTLDSLAAGSYPLAKQFFATIRHDAHSEVRQFIAFVLSPEGQRILQDNGNRPLAGLLP